MKVEFHLKNCKRESDKRVQLEHIFKMAVLDYCPSVEKLSVMRDDDPMEYLQTLRRGWWSLEGHIPASEIAGMSVELRFSK